MNGADDMADVSRWRQMSLCDGYSRLHGGSHGLRLILFAVHPLTTANQLSPET